MKYTQLPLDGYHCLDESYSLHHNISGIDQFGCVRQCILSYECTILMYNLHNGVCVLGAQPCAVTEPHGQLMTMVFREEETLECLVPQAVSELDSGSRLITIWNRRSLARVERGGNIYVGHSNTPDGGNNWGYFRFGSEQFRGITDHFLLTVSPQCSVAWLPYTAGQPIPFRAVMCGMLNGKQVYTLRGTNPTSAEYQFAMYVSGHLGTSWTVTSATWILVSV